MTSPRYAVSVWLSAHRDEAGLQDYIGRFDPGGKYTSQFAAESGLGHICSDFMEALCYAPPLHLFDTIDKVSYGKYFRSECVKMLYPLQFADYSAVIFVYGYREGDNVVHGNLFTNNVPRPAGNGELYHVGCILFEVPGP